MEHSIASLEHSGKTKTPGEPQEWREDPNALADLKQAVLLLLARLVSYGGSQDLGDDHNRGGHVHHHDDQRWDDKGEQGLGVLPVEPTGILPHVDFLGLGGSHRDDGDDERAAIAKGKRNGLLNGLAGVVQDENQAVQEHEAQSQHPEKNAKVEKVDKESGSHAGCLVEWVVIVVDGGGHNEPDVSNKKGGSNVRYADVTHIGSPILGH